MQPEQHRIIWAMGGRSSTELAHAYVSEEALKNANCLCGCGAKPHLIFDSWDLENELNAEHTCPRCRERLKFLAYLREDHR